MKIFYRVVIICLMCFSLFSHEKKNEVTGLKILILGGTTFLGPYLTNELLTHGHKVTHFNRGNEHGFDFPEVEKLQGNRDGNLKALEGRRWDAIIDTSGYLPRVVEASSKILAKATRHYTFISTISVYEDFNQPYIDENGSVSKIINNSDEKITDKTYGPFKAGCEKVIQTYFPENSLIIRPGLIVGPLDPTDRFTFWVRRIAEGGRVLVPSSLEQKLQIIDVRDLTKWIVKMVEEGATGIYNATGPKEELRFEDFINSCIQLGKKKVELVCADENFLIDHHLDNWNKLPLWFSSKSKMFGLFNISSQKAQKKGLSFRPLKETISDIIDWDTHRMNKKMKIGLSRDEEEIFLREISENGKE
jgi:2'-hydroxyisoflavone reductase